jgi:hypothetical protein
MTYTPTNWVDGSTPLNRANMMKIENELAALDPLAPGAPSATPPGSPVDGQFWLLPADATNGVQWMFRYNAGSASAYKWEFVGGAPLSHEVAGDESTTSATYVDLGTLGPTVTVPRAGDFMVAFGCGMYNLTAAASAFIAPKRGAAVTSDNDASQWDIPTAAKLGVLMRTIRIVGLAASDVVKLQYRVGSGQGQFRNRWLNVTPIRVS